MQPQLGIMDAKHRVGLHVATANSILQALNAPTSSTSLWFSPPRPLLVCMGPKYALYSDELESVQKFATKVIARQWNSHWL